MVGAILGAAIGGKGLAYHGYHLSFDHNSRNNILVKGVDT